MKNIFLMVSLILQFSLSQAQATAATSAGEIKGPFIWKSKIYPGTERDYWVYVPKQYDATSMGIQLSDQLGRVNFIFSKPAESAFDTKLGGIDFNTLYVSCGGKLFSRKFNSKGIASWLPPVKPSKPGMLYINKSNPVVAVTAL